MIHVTLEGKPVAAAQVEIATVHGVPLKKLKTDQIGVANYKLTPGDYIITASTADASNMVKITVSATSSVAVTVALTPTAKP
jgi:protein-tyrosine-phosphatase